MTTFELSKLTQLDNTLFLNYAPFVYVAYPECEYSWDTDSSIIIGSPTETINITSFVRDSVNVYSKTTSLSDCMLIEQSFYWDSANQALYVHIEHDQSIIGPKYQYGLTFGYCDKRACYIGNIFYAPILKSVPSLAQTQDLEAYDQLSFLSGAVVLNNVGGMVDEILEESFLGYDCFIGYLEDDDRDDYDRDEIIYLAALYVEDYTASPKEVTINVQDRRKAGNIKIPTELFDEDDYPDASDSVIGKPIPLMYGLVRAAPAICTNGETESGDVEYRVAQEITALGTVQVKIDDVWTDVTPSSYDLDTGSFVLASSDGRDSETLRDCRVVGATGISVTHSSDIIKDLNERYLDIQYTESEYDKDEWEEAEEELETVGLYIDSQIELYEAIRQVQSGSNIGFRYEFESNGQRTIRLDDPEREPIARICVEDLEDLYDLPVETDSDLLAATVKVDYAKDYTADKDEEYLTVIDESQKETVTETYRQTPQLEFETLLTTKSHAEARALVDAEKFGTLRQFLTVNAMGKEFLNLRIYDTVEIEATPGFVDADFNTIEGEREWLGVWKAQVLGVEPDLEEIKNTLRLVLIEKQEAHEDLEVLIDEDGEYVPMESGSNYLVRVA